MYLLLQGALIASALILIQHTDGMNSKSGKIRERYSKMIGDKLEDSVAKFGAIIAQGIIDAGIYSESQKEVFYCWMYMQLFEGALEIDFIVVFYTNNPTHDSQ